MFDPRAVNRAIPGRRRRDREHHYPPPQHHQDARAHLAARLGAGLLRARRQVPVPLQVPGQGQGPDEAHHAGVPADGAREGRARLRRPRCRGPGRDDQQDRPALDGDHQAVHRHHRLRRSRRRAHHVDADRRDPEQRAAQRLPRAVRRRDPSHRHADGARPLVRQARAGPIRLAPRPRGPGKGPRHAPGAQHALALHRRRPRAMRVHAAGGRRDGLHEYRVRGASRRRRSERRLHAADHLPVGAVRRGPPHLERLRDASHRAAGRRERAADRARPRAGVVDQPCLPRRVRLGDHGVQLRRPLRPRELPRQVGALDRERLVPLLRSEARQARTQLPGRDVRPRARPAQARPRPQEHAELCGLLDAAFLAHGRARPSATSNGSRTSTRAGTRSMGRRGRRSARRGTTRSSSSTS